MSICGYSCRLLWPSCLLLSFSQAQTNKAKQDSSLMFLFFGVSVIIHVPTCLWHQFMSLSGEWKATPIFIIGGESRLFYGFVFKLTPETVNHTTYGILTLSLAYPPVIIVINDTPGHLFPRQQKLSCCGWNTHSLLFFLLLAPSSSSPENFVYLSSHLPPQEPEWDSKAFCPNQLFLSG